jgi:nitrogen fixation NifU-like protein
MTSVTTKHVTSELYQKVVLEHNRSPRHYGPLLHSTHSALGRNPICGDEVSVFLDLEKNQIRSIGFTAQGCALCRASASMMCEVLNGLGLQSAEQLQGNFKSLLAGNPDAQLPGDLAALGVVKDFSARAKCVLLPWQTLAGALSGQKDISTETCLPDSESVSKSVSESNSNTISNSISR